MKEYYYRCPVCKTEYVADGLYDLYCANDECHKDYDVVMEVK